MATEDKKAPTPKEIETAVETGVSKWVELHLMNSGFSTDTQAWNFFMSSRADLVAAIKGEF